MKIYTPRVRAMTPCYVSETYWASKPQAITVIEERDARGTGLLDHRGIPIMSVNEIGPIGFNRY